MKKFLLLLVLLALPVQAGTVQIHDLAAVTVPTTADEIPACQANCQADPQHVAPKKITVGQIVSLAAAPSRLRVLTVAASGGDYTTIDAAVTYINTQTHDATHRWMIVADNAEPNALPLYPDHDIPTFVTLWRGNEVTANGMPGSENQPLRFTVNGGTGDITLSAAYLALGGTTRLFANDALYLWSSGAVDIQSFGASILAQSGAYSLDLNRATPGSWSLGSAVGVNGSIFYDGSELDVNAQSINMMLSGVSKLIFSPTTLFAGADLDMQGNRVLNSITQSPSGNTASRPATCSVGDPYLDTQVPAHCWCVAPNTWKCSLLS